MTISKKMLWIGGLGVVLVLLGSLGIYYLLSKPSGAETQVTLTDKSQSISVQPNSLLRVDVVTKGSTGESVKSISMQQGCTGLSYEKSDTFNEGNNLPGGDSLRTSYWYKVTSPSVQCTIVATMLTRGVINYRYLLVSGTIELVR